MAKVKNALFSFGASGTVAGLLTINQSSKTQAARRKPSGYAAPTAPQSGTRQKMRDAATAWRALAPLDRADWSALATGRATTPFAKYLLEWMAQHSTPATPPALPMA